MRYVFALVSAIGMSFGSLWAQEEKPAPVEEQRENETPQEPEEANDETVTRDAKRRDSIRENQNLRMKAMVRQKSLELEDARAKLAEAKALCDRLEQEVKLQMKALDEARAGADQLDFGGLEERQLREMLSRLSTRQLDLRLEAAEIAARAEAAAKAVAQVEEKKERQTNDHQEVLAIQEKIVELQKKRLEALRTRASAGELPADEIDREAVQVLKEQQQFESMKAEFIREWQARVEQVRERAEETRNRANEVQFLEKSIQDLKRELRDSLRIREEMAREIMTMRVAENRSRDSQRELEQRMAELRDREVELQRMRFELEVQAQSGKSLPPQDESAPPAKELPAKDAPDAEAKVPQ